MYDAIVVGARCAGSATAMLLARRGWRVLLLDRATLPSETLSTLYIQQLGVERLANWGLLHEVAASGCPPLRSIFYRIADIRLESEMPALAGNAATYAPRRRVLDPILMEAAVRAGAEFQDRCAIIGLLWSNGRVVGVQATTNGGPTRSLAAKIVIGADGMRSTVARLAGALEASTHPILSCVYYSAWQGLSATFGFVELPARWLAVIPTHDGMTILATYFPQKEFQSVRARAMAAHREAIHETAPEIFAQIEDLEPAEPLRGSGDQQNFSRNAGGPGWALVGDAGHHQDSISARGITDALIGAELLADSIGDRPDDQAGLDQALRDYGARRDGALRDSYRSTLTLAKLCVDDSRLSVMRAIADVPDLTYRFFSVLGGILPVSALSTPQLLAAIGTMSSKRR